MADSITSSLNLSTESSQVAAGDAGEIESTSKAAAGDAGEIESTSKAAAEDGSLTHITFMDPRLYLAAADGDTDALEKLDGQFNILVQLTPKKNTVLHVAAQFGQPDCVKCILRLGSPSSLLKQLNEKDETPLHLAAREGHLTVVQNLIAAANKLRGDTEGGAAEYCKEMLRMTNKGEDTALHEAVRYHHTEVVRLLILQDPEYTYAPNIEGNTPLYIAAEWGFGDLVQMILENCKSPGHSGIKGRTALHAAVILNDQAMVEKILKWKRSLTKELDGKGWSPLHFAAYVGCRPTIVGQLLEKYAECVVYLGVKDHRNRTALHIAASRGHVDIVKMLVSHFPDCCEKVDNDGNNFLHLIMPKSVIFVFSGLSNIRRIRVRGLMNEKNAEGKTPLHLFHDSVLPKDVHPEESILGTLRLRRRSQSSRVRPLGSLEIAEDSDDRESKESEEISEIKKTMKNHMIVATLIATVTFAAGFTLPGGYIQNDSNNQGMAVLSLPTNGTKGKDRQMAIAVREKFKFFVMADSTAMVLSLCAIGIYFLASFPIINKKTAMAYLLYGYVLTLGAMLAMVTAFVVGLQAVIHHSSLLEDTTNFILPFFLLLFLVPSFFTFTPSPRWILRSILYRKKVKSVIFM